MSAPAIERTDPPAVHPVDERLPFTRLGVLGLQHVLIMYTGCVTVPLIFGNAMGLDASTIAILINADLVVAGVITIIQSVGIGKFLGVRLPIVAGATFAGLTPMILIGQEYGLQAVYGSMIAAGIFGILIAIPFASIVRFFPPVVTGSVITVIGISLLGAAGGLIVGNNPDADSYASVSNVLLAFGVIAVILLVTRFVRGLLGQLAVLIGLIVGTIVAVPMGLVDFSSVSDARWIGFSQPLYFGAPEFPIAAVISMCVVMLVIFTESTADMLAVSALVGKELTPKDLAKGLAADGLSGVFAGFYNSFLDTAFAQNVGLISVTKVKSRFVVTAAGIILLALGALPKMGEVIASLPGPVIGAAGLVMFAMVSTVGIRSLSKVEFEGTHNLMLIACAIGLGLLPAVAPAVYSNFPDWFQIIFGSEITTAAFVAFGLNLFFNHWMVRPAVDVGPMDAGADSAVGAPATVDITEPFEEKTH